MNKYEEALLKIGNCYLASEGVDLMASETYSKEYDLLQEATEKASDNTFAIAMRLIKKKDVNMQYIMAANSVEDYNRRIGGEWIHNFLPKEIWDEIHSLTIDEFTIVKKAYENA